MFASLVSAVVLAGSIAMPPLVDNDYLGPNKDWAPLNAAYVACAEQAVSTFSYFVCADSAYNKAMMNLKEA